jgi:hypothetical protein
MESGEYIFGLKDVSGNGSDTVVEFLAIVGDNDRVTDAGTDVYGDSVIF